MEGTYEVTLGSKRMGSVTLKKQGLYWLFDCRCDLSGEVMYDLILTAGETQYDLGILSPAKDSFICHCKLACKKLEKGSLKFYLRPRHAKLNTDFVPVYPEEPFRYLHLLETSFLSIRGGQIGLICSEKNNGKKSN